MTTPSPAASADHKIVTDSLGFPLRVELEFGDYAGFRANHYTHQDADTGLVPADADHKISVQRGLAECNLVEAVAHECYHMFFSVRHLITADEETQAEVFGQLVRRIYLAAEADYEAHKDADTLASHKAQEARIEELELEVAQYRSLLAAPVAAQEGVTLKGLLDDDAIAKLAWKHLGRKNADALTFDRSPEFFPQATYSVPTVELCNFVDAVIEAVAPLLAAPRPSEAIHYCWHKGDRCAECGQAWPCDTMKAAL